MNKFLIVITIFFVFFNSCDTDFNVNADWEEVTVVFGLLDQSQDTQYVRVNKAFLGDQDAYQMAAVSDSLNYAIEDLEVKIQRVKYSGSDLNILDEVILDDTIMFKDEGDFASDHNLIYFFKTNNFLVEDKKFILTITNLRTGNVVSSETNLIHDLSLMSSFNNPAYKMGFYNQSGDFSATTIEWTHAENAAIYEITMFLNYTEYGQDTIVKTISKVFPIIPYNGNSDMSQKITGEEFFNFIANSIKENNNVNRRINNIDLLFSAGTSELQTYINLNQPPTGIVQERPVFTNVDNGIGIFTSRYNKLQENISITNTTKEAISFHLDSLNFIFP